MPVTQSQPTTAGPRVLSGPSAADRQWWQPRRSTRKLLTVVHVASSVALLGEVWVLVVLNLTATLTSDGALAHASYRLMGVLVFGGGIPLSMSSLVSGIALGLGSRWGIARHSWVFAKLLLLIGVILAGMLLFTPEVMADASAGGASPSEGRQWTQVAVVSTQAAMLLTATALSVYKPRRRIGLRRSGS